MPTPPPPDASTNATDASTNATDASKPAALIRKKSKKSKGGKGSQRDFDTVAAADSRFTSLYSKTFGESKQFSEVAALYAADSVTDQQEAPPTGGAAAPARNVVEWMYEQRGPPRGVWAAHNEAHAAHAHIV
eukprot:gene11302-45251_t